jgi:micrococcal nuclease
MENMFMLIFALALALFMIFPTFIPMQAHGHRSGCHAAHSCPSDTGSYVCGDTGNDSQCPGNNSEGDDEPKKKKVNQNEVKSESDSTPTKPTLPSETISEGIEITGPINYVTDGDTLEVNQISIRLSLVNTPEVGEAGFHSAKNFVEKLCLDKNGEVDIDDGQRQGSFGREIGVVYCDGVNLNSELMSKGYALISTEFCDVSEFSAEPWAKSSCQVSSDGNNNPPDYSNQNSDSLSKKLEHQTPFDSESSESNEAQSYSNSKLGISLKHPTDWKVGNLKNGIQLIKEKNGVYVEIRKHNLDSSDVQLKQYAGDDIKDRSSSREDFKLLNITKTTISGNLPAYKALYTFLKTENEKDFTIEGTTNRILRMWTFAENNAYHVAFVADNDKYDVYLPIAEKIIDTLKINPGSQQSFSDNDSNDKKKSSNQENENSNHKGSSSNEDSDGGSGRCKDGYHKDESGECEKVVDNKGKPRCPNGYHRSPDGDCERARD